MHLMLCAARSRRSSGNPWFGLSLVPHMRVIQAGFLEITSFSNRAAISREVLPPRPAFTGSASIPIAFKLETASPHHPAEPDP